MGWQREAHLARLSLQCLGIRDATRYRVVSSGGKLRGSVGWAGEAAKKTKPKGPPRRAKRRREAGEMNRGKKAALCGYLYLRCQRRENTSRSHSTPTMTHEYAQPPGRWRWSRVHRLRGARAKPASASLRSRALKGVQPGPLWHGDGRWHDPMAGNLQRVHGCLESRRCARAIERRPQQQRRHRRRRTSTCAL